MRNARHSRYTQDVLASMANGRLEVYFAVLTIVILGGIVGLGSYTALSIIPEWKKYRSLAWQRSHSPVNPAYPQSVEYSSYILGDSRQESNM